MDTLATRLERSHTSSNGVAFVNDEPLFYNNEVSGSILLSVD